MRNKIFISIILIFVVFAGVSFSQEINDPEGLCIMRVSRVTTKEKPDTIPTVGQNTGHLSTEFVQLQKFVIPGHFFYAADTFNGVPFEDERQQFIEHLKRMLTHRGAVEIDLRKNTLIVTDTKQRVAWMIEYLKWLDESGLTFDQLIDEGSSFKENK